MKLRTPLVALLLLSVFVLDGCTTPAKTASKESDDEYVTLPPKTGSHLPRRVKKSDLLAGKVPDADAAQEVNKEQFAQSVRPGVKTGAP